MWNIRFPAQCSQFTLNSFSLIWLLTSPHCMCVCIHLEINICVFQWVIAQWNAIVFLISYSFVYLTFSFPPLPPLKKLFSHRDVFFLPSLTSSIEWKFFGLFTCVRPTSFIKGLEIYLILFLLLSEILKRSRISTPVRNCVWFSSFSVVKKLRKLHHRCEWAISMSNSTAAKMEMSEKFSKQHFLPLIFLTHSQILLYQLVFISLLPRNLLCVCVCVCVS